ncbi:hypothetical protein CC80DRAFT_527125 [Byssothecium circinans]|uniref:NAD(P)-binding protein n=1 Tax=Byssothecium circinans TaxID=147558 RepID=A0A6A5TP42_9PLEO|nr:hypothetical protein CC80DRAFT_527125 [Byssothecium circinans]
MSALWDVIKALFNQSNPTFDSARDIPSLTGRVILLSGANTGIGKQTALELAKHDPAQVWVGERNLQTGRQALSDIQAVASPKTAVELLELDLTSLMSVKAAARKLVAQSDRLDILVLNEWGPWETAKRPVKGTEPHALRLSSDSYKTSVVPKTGIDFDTLKTERSQYSGITKYCQSKLANTVYAAPIVKLYPQFTTLAILENSIGKKDTESDAVREGKLKKRLWEWTKSELEGHAL